MRNKNPVNEVLVDIDKDQIWLAKEIERSRTFTNQVINGKQTSWATRRKIASVLKKPENELFPESVAV